MPINPSPKWRAAVSEAQKKLWQNPEHRAKMVAARRKLIPLWKAYPERFSRRGVPNGMRKPEAMKLWSEANRLADLAMRGFEAQGIVPKVPMPTSIPDTDEEIAKLCLREACVIALGPGNDKRTKLQALGIVLKYTRPKPAQRQSVTVTGTSEDWLRSAIMAGSIAAGAEAEGG
jgi:hypothetical protein